MPHSSGGGSRGGGFHGGSGFSGGYARSSTRLYNSGSGRYHDDDPEDRRKRTSPVVLIAIIISLLCVAVGFALPFCMQKKGLKADLGVDAEILIEDNADILKDTDELQRSLEDLYEETGIIPAFITVKDEMWRTRYSNMEKYAYELYEEKFSDEYHWLLVYSIDDTGRYFTWQVIVGDSLDPYMNQKVATAAYKKLQSNFENGDYTVDEAVVNAVDYMTPRISEGSDNENFIGVCIIGGIIVIIIAIIVVVKKCSNKRYEDE